MKRIVAMLLVTACASLAPQRIRVEKREIAGTRLTIDAGLPKPVELLITPAAIERNACDLLIHFHGAAWLPMQAAGNRALCVAVVNLGAGSSVYERPMREPDAFAKLLGAIRAKTPPVSRIYLTSFSAGYGATRAILRDHAADIDGVLLLDGLHTGYTDTGDIENEKMEPFRQFAAAAAEGRKRFVVTHSSIIPGTYASTGETAADLIRSVSATRVVKKRMRFGMVELYEVHCGGFHVLGFAGDAAPDHIDQFHAMPEVLALLLEAI